MYWAWAFIVVGIVVRLFVSMASFIASYKAMVPLGERFAWDRERVVPMVGFHRLVDIAAEEHHGIELNDFVERLRDATRQRGISVMRAPRADWQRSRLRNRSTYGCTFQHNTTQLNTSAN